MSPLRRRDLLISALAADMGDELSGARLQGRGRLRFLGLRIYDIRLWVGAATVDGDWERAAGTTPLALEIEYARSLVGAQIAERSLVEMRRQGPIDEASATRWLAAMTELFPDVAEGDRITGVHQPGRGARFYLNGRRRGELADADFARRFFGIWLAPQTSEPSLRGALLGTGTS